MSLLIQIPACKVLGVVDPIRQISVTSCGMQLYHYALLTQKLC